MFGLCTYFLNEDELNGTVQREVVNELWRVNAIKYYIAIKIMDMMTG